MLSFILSKVLVCGTTRSVLVLDEFEFKNSKAAIVVSQEFVQKCDFFLLDTKSRFLTTLLVSEKESEEAWSSLCAAVEFRFPSLFDNVLRFVSIGSGSLALTYL